MGTCHNLDKSSCMSEVYIYIYKVVPQFVGVQLVYKYYFTRVDEWGLYRTSYWDYKPINISGGGHHLQAFPIDA